HCHSNLVRAVLPYGLTELDVHDVINVFQVTGLMEEDERYFMKTSPARVGDHFELFCEIDLLMAVSTCPGGDLSVPIWGPESGGGGGAAGWGVGGVGGGGGGVVANLFSSPTPVSE